MRGNRSIIHNSRIDSERFMASFHAEVLDAVFAISFPVLYNLKQDPSETTNLAAAEVEKREELSSLLTVWAEEIEAIEPEVNPEYVPWPEREPCGHFAVEVTEGGSGGASGLSQGGEMGASDPRVWGCTVGASKNGVLGRLRALNPDTSQMT